MKLPGHRTDWNKSGMPNFFDGLPHAARDELVEKLVTGAQVRIERIVSTGQASPDGFWYDQDEREWVIVLKGRAELRFEDEAESRFMSPGDFVDIEPHRRHRVESTSLDEPTVWLAVFIG